MAGKIFLVARREYLTRVRKKSFIVMTILAPLLMAVFYGVIIYLSINREIGNTVKDIYVNDQTGLFKDKLKDDKFITFTTATDASTQDPYTFLKDNNYHAVLELTYKEGSSKPVAQLIYLEQPGITTVGFIEDEVNRVLHEKELLRLGINQDSLNAVNADKINFTTIEASQEGMKSGSAEVTSAIGYIAAIAIYMFIFLYGVQVMQGVIEEKTNRIVEIIISSIKPFQLMMGKITGIAMVGLTQFVIWIVLLIVLGSSVSGWVLSHYGTIGNDLKSAADTGGGNQILAALGGINYTLILGMFLFYFIGGYLFYGALFAAIGSAVDNETDKQQFMLPVTLPLVFALVLSQSVIMTNPNGSMATWLSLIPFTSPIAMMVRIPFGVPVWEIVLSMVCMIGGIMFTVWLASKIYRVGILMYGKKASYPELWKWLFYKS
jgi:ABC-2 type transport system permease protein